MSKLRQFLTANRLDAKLPRELWEVISRNNGIFAVEDQELTQTTPATHKITASIRQRARPVPLGALVELRNHQAVAEARIIERSHPPCALPMAL